jgi:hypothetical protein
MSKVKKGERKKLKSDGNQGHIEEIIHQHIDTDIYQHRDTAVTGIELHHESSLVERQLE